VLASDGVFEFLTNRKTCDIMMQYEDMLEGCHAVVSEAYERWFEHEDRTDDITVIIIRVNEDSDSISPPISRTNSVRRRVSKEQFEQKRPRKSVDGATSLLDVEGIDFDLTEEMMKLPSPDGDDDLMGGDGDGDGDGDGGDNENEREEFVPEGNLTGRSKGDTEGDSSPRSKNGGL
jgi:hypothetical protein